MTLTTLDTRNSSPGTKVPGRADPRTLRVMSAALANLWPRRRGASAISQCLRATRGLTIASVLKHTQCPACGHPHHFCCLGPVLVPGRAYEFICPENAKKALLRPTSAGEAVKVPPQGAIALDE